MENETDDMVAEQTELPVEDTRTAGERLRAARREQGMELSHVAAETRIPQRHLETIESGDFDELPSRAYAIGFARTYARIVGLNDKEITDAVREELAEGHARQSALAGGMEPGDPAKLPSRGLAWAGAFAALILVVGLVSFFNTYFGAGTGPAPLVAEADPADADGGELAANDASGEGEGAANGRPINANGQVVFTALEDGVWVRFYEDQGDRLFEALMENGDTFEVPSDAEAPLINTGRPDALSITIDGRGVPKLAEEPVTIGDAPVSAEALLARVDTAQLDTAQLDSGQIDPRADSPVENN